MKQLGEQSDGGRLLLQGEEFSPRQIVAELDKYIVGQ
jgi:translation initiation factor 2 beta subunit (eIF-2beta)/eIF-5